MSSGQRTLVFLMDPIESVDIRADTTFALMLEAQARGCRVLELGHVLSHYVDPSNYGFASHTVVDKYETSAMANVHNVDIVDFESDALFDLIVSVSTIEHIGWDESPRDPEKVLLALQCMQGLLSADPEILS